MGISSFILEGCLGGIKMYHKIILVGNLGQDPTMRYTSEGTPVTSFSMAVNEKWNNSEGELQTRTVWLRVSAWRRLAETCNQYLHKGSQVLVEARFDPDPETGNPRTFTRNDGSTGASYEVTALTVKFLGKKNGNGYTPDEANAPPETGSESEIPF